MVDHACAGDAAEVPADVVALRRERLRQGAHAGCRQPVQLERLRPSRQLRELRDVPVRSNHQVAGRVRVLVEQAEGLLAALDDEAVGVRCGSCAAEDAAFLLVGAGDVLEPPRSPQLLHVAEATPYSRPWTTTSPRMIKTLEARMSRRDIASALGVEERELDEIASGYVPDEEIADRLRALVASGASGRVVRIPTKAIRHLRDRRRRVLRRARRLSRLALATSQCLSHRGSWRGRDRACSSRSMNRTQWEAGPGRRSPLCGAQRTPTKAQTRGGLSRYVVVPRPCQISRGLAAGWATVDVTLGRTYGGARQPEGVVLLDLRVSSSHCSPLPGRLLSQGCNVWSPTVGFSLPRGSRSSQRRQTPLWTPPAGELSAASIWGGMAWPAKTRLVTWPIDHVL